jgi:hypothetical protein
MRQLLLTALASFALAGSAAANFTGPNVRVTSTEALGLQGQPLRVYSVFLDFDPIDPDAYTLLAVYNHRVVSGSMAGVMHADQELSWNPTVTNTAIASIDSFVTISGLGGAASGTALDPSFGTGIGSVIPSLAGWYDMTPQIANSAASIKVMQIALGADDPGYTASVRVGYKRSGTTTPLFTNLEYSITTVVPAPGALALFAFVGLAARRRR